MSMGSPGDHPLTDLLYWGRNEFPVDIADMLLALHKIDPRLTKKFGRDAWDWVGGRDLEAARAALQLELERQKKH